MKILRITLVIIVLGYLVPAISASTNTSPTIYLTFVTDGLGFYKVRNLEMPPRFFTYNERVLNINQGDTIIWENDADTSTLTIVSDQNLWNNKVGQIKVGNRINYKFNDPGTYTFSIKEVPSKRQTIVVNFIDNGETIPTGTYSPIPTAIETYSVPTVTYSPIPTHTPSPTMTYSPISTRTPSQTQAPIKLPIKITPTTIASMIVVIVSIYIAYMSGKR